MTAVEKTPLTSLILCIFIFRFLSARYQKSGLGVGFMNKYIFTVIYYIYYVIYSFLCDNTMQSTPAKAEDKYSGELQLIRLHSCFISLWCLHGTQHENEHVFKQYLKNWIHKRAIIKGKEKPKRI